MSSETNGDRTPGAEDTITRSELAEALRDRFRASGVWNYATLVNPDQAAADLFLLAAAHREPEYRPGEVWQDKLGGKYIRTADPVYPWLRVEASGEVARQFPDVPQRPLRKLVAEGPDKLAADLRGLAEGYRLLASNRRDLDRNCTASAAYGAAAGDIEQALKEASRDH